MFSAEQTFPENSHSDLREFISLGLWGTLQVTCICSSLYLARAESLPDFVRFALILQHLAEHGCTVLIRNTVHEVAGT